MTEINKYFRTIEKGLPCSRKLKTAFMKDFKSSVLEYISASKNATINDIRAEFGQEEEIISSFSYDGNVDSKAIFIKRLVVGAVCVALAIWLAFAVISIIDVHNEAYGYFEEGTVSPTEEVQ